jgi:chromosome segregation ATPase
MEQLQELEKRVLGLISTNKNIQADNDRLSKEVRELKEKCDRLETSLMSRDESEKSFKSEKAIVKSTVEKLLRTIGSLDSE